MNSSRSSETRSRWRKGPSLPYFNSRWPCDRHRDRRLRPLCAQAIAETISNINDAIISSIKNSLCVGTYGRCGGMAFAAADYFYKNWVVPQGTGANDQPDTSTPGFSALRSYIWQRLIDSIENNVDTWVYWMAALNLDPSGGPKWLRDHTLLQFEDFEVHHRRRKHGTAGADWPCLSNLEPVR